MPPSSAEDDTGKRRDVDYIFEEVVGGCGWWQVRTTLFLFPLFWASIYPVFLPVFAANAPRHRCFVEQCDSQLIGADGNLTQPWVKFALPTGKVTVGSAKRKIGRSEPSTFLCPQSTLRATSSPRPRALTLATSTPPRPAETTPALPSLLSRDLQTTVAATNMCTIGLNSQRLWPRNLTLCATKITREDSWGNFKFWDSIGALFFTNSFLCVHASSTIMMIGFMVGSLVGGTLGDKFGRKNVMYAGTLINIPCVIASGFIPNYTVYAILRFIICACMTVIWVTSHTYGLEYFSPKYRRVITCVKGGFETGTAGFFNHATRSFVIIVKFTKL